MQIGAGEDGRHHRLILRLPNANVDYREIWGEDAEEFKPERWLSALPQSVSEAKLPGIYSPR
jgi:hypothetical protein